MGFIRFRFDFKLRGLEMRKILRCERNSFGFGWGLRGLGLIMDIYVVFRYLFFN